MYHPILPCHHHSRVPPRTTLKTKNFDSWMKVPELTISDSGTAAYQPSLLLMPDKGFSRSITSLIRTCNYFVCYFRVSTVIHHSTNLSAILSVDLSLDPLHLTRGYRCMISTVEKIWAAIATGPTKICRFYTSENRASTRIFPNARWFSLAMKFYEISAYHLIQTAYPLITNETPNPSCCGKNRAPLGGPVGGKRDKCHSESEWKPSRMLPTPT